MSKILFESEGKTLDGKPFLTVKKARGYFVYAERGGMDSIAFVLHDRHNQKFGLINESKPPLDERMDSKFKLTTAFGGSIDSDKSPIEICKQEVLEEAGFDAGLDSIRHIGKTMVSTQMSQLCDGYLVDVTWLEQGETEDSRNEVVWLDRFELMENSDWKSIWIVATAEHKGLI